MERMEKIGKSHREHREHGEGKKRRIPENGDIQTIGIGIKESKSIGQRSAGRL
jgi:hypothetical protein